MRCRLGEKKVARLAKKHGLPIVMACARGGTDHRIDVWMADGQEGSIFKDGEYVPSECFLPVVSDPEPPKVRELINLGHSLSRQETIMLELALR